MFERLFRYDRWANRIIAAAIHAAPTLYDDTRVTGLFSHVLAAQQVWQARVEGRATGGMAIWPSLPPETWGGYIASLYDGWQAILASSERDLERLVSYNNSRDEPFETPIQDILMHVVIHGQHHRAQIASLMRAAGIAPPATDFIVFTRAPTQA